MEVELELKESGCGAGSGLRLTAEGNFTRKPSI